MRSAIEALLRELEAVVGGLHPAWIQGWQPGLYRAEIDAALAPLNGWRPPEDILALYAWRNGQAGTEPSCLWVPMGVVPLQDAVASFLRMHEMFPTAPPLFGIGYGNATHLEVALSRAARESAPLYLRDNEGSPFYAFTGLEGLLRACLDAYRGGHFRWASELRFWTTTPDRADDNSAARDALQALRRRWNPGTSPTLWDEAHEARGVLWISTFDPSDWPAEWQDFIGFDAAAAKPRGATATVTDVALGRVDWSQPIIVEATVDGLMGSGHETRVHLSDGMQSIEVLCRGVLAAGVCMRDRFEFELERPLTATERTAHREHDALLGAAIRDSLQGAAAAGSATPADADVLLFADLLSTDLAASPAFVAKRVAVVARRPAGAPADEHDSHPQDPAAHCAASADGLPELARMMLESYREPHRLEPEFREVAIEDIPDTDVELYQRIDCELEALGFRRLGTYEISNLTATYPAAPRVAIRSYADAEGVTCSFHTLPPKTWASLMPPSQPPHYGVVELTTEYDDGRVILTSSAGRLVPYDAPPSVTRTLLPLGARLGEVLDRHRAQVTSIPGRPIVPRSLHEHLTSQRALHATERDFAQHRIPTVQELVRAGLPPELARRLQAAMEPDKEPALG